MFSDINKLEHCTTGFTIDLDDRCLKLVSAYTNEDKSKSKYCVHYMNINKVRELRDALSDALVGLEEQIIELEGAI